MKLHSIRLINYRSYYKEHTLEVARSKVKNVTLIHGAMGAGKTKLFSAIQWCFYGEEEYDETPSSNEDIMNSVAQKDSLHGKPSETMVEILFDHNQVKYRATRKFQCFNGRAENGMDFKLLKANDKGDYDGVKDDDVVMNSILPKHLRQYFMFDGEKIQNYSKPGHETDIQKAIKGLLGFDDIEKAIDNLSKIDDEYNTLIRRNSKNKELQDVIDEVASLKERFSKCGSEIIQKESEIAKGQKIVQKIEKEQAKIERVREYIEKQDKLKEALTSYEIKKNLLYDEIAEHTDNIYLTMMTDVVVKVDSLYNSLTQKGEIPAPIRAEFIKKLLDKEKCICGRPLKNIKDKKAIDILLNLYSKQNTQLDNIVTKIPNDLADIRIKSHDVELNLIQKLKEESDFQSKMKSIRDDLKEISNYLKNSDAEAVARKEKEKENVEKLLDHNKAEKIKLILEKESLENDLKALAEKRDKLLSNENEFEDLKIQQTYTGLIKSTLTKLYKIYEGEVKKRVKEAIEEIFSEFMWKKDHYREVVIQDDYVLDIYDRNNRLAREGLSAGERQCFSLAFVIALARVTEKEAPFIVDTPLGRIAKDPGEIIDPRIQIIKALPRLLTQVILFVTYEEIREGEECDKIISPKVGQRYKLKYDKENGCTKVKHIKQ